MLTEKSKFAVPLKVEELAVPLNRMAFLTEIFSKLEPTKLNE